MPFLLLLPFLFLPFYSARPSATAFYFFCFLHWHRCAHCDTKCDISPIIHNGIFLFTGVIFALKIGKNPCKESFKFFIKFSTFNNHFPTTHVNNFSFFGYSQISHNGI